MFALGGGRGVDVEVVDVQTVSRLVEVACSKNEWVAQSKEGKYSWEELRDWRKEALSRRQNERTLRNLGSIVQQSGRGRQR